MYEQFSTKIDSRAGVTSETYQTFHCSKNLNDFLTHKKITNFLIFVIKYNIYI